MTHRITTFPHEARRFQEAGSVLIVREPEREIQVYEDQVSYGGVLLPTMADLVESFCPFPAPGEEVWFAEPYVLDGAEYLKSVNLMYADAEHIAERVAVPWPEGVESVSLSSKVKPATEMPEWAARLRGVVVSRECRRVSTITDDESRDAGHLPCIEQGEVLLSESEVFFDLFESDPWAWVVRIEKNPENP